MTGPKLALYAAVVCAVGWTAKMAVMTGQGGPDEESVPEAIAFFVGLIGFLVFAAAVGSTLAAGRSTAVRVAAAVAGVVVAAVVLGVVQSLLSALPGDDWWQPESALVVGGVAALAIAGALRRRTGPSGRHEAALHHDA